jgi:two-component system chemotaxis sensor kinase CheA
MNEAEFLEKLREAFAIESDEHFRTIRSGLAEIEQDDSDPVAVIELIFREAHSLKGAARAINRADIEALCQGMESLLAAWKKEPSSRTKVHYSLLEKAMDLLEELLESEEEYSMTEPRLQSLADDLKAESAVLNRDRLQALPIPPVPPEMCGNPGRQVGAESKDVRPEPAAPVASRPVAEASTESGGQDSETRSADSSFPSEQHTRSENSTDAGEKEGSVLAPHAGNGNGEMEGNSTSRRSRNGRDVVRDTVRVSIAELDALYRQTEELSSVKYMIGRSASDLRLVMDQCREWIREYQKFRQSALEQVRGAGEASRIPPQQSEEYEKLQHFMKWTARQIEGVESSVGKAIEDGRGTMYIMDTLADTMMDQAKQLLLLPFALLTDTLAPMVRKIARDLEKDVQFEVTGDDIRIDKRILEMLKDPLVHLLRNSLDHGIEEGAVRIKSGKSAQGSIAINISVAQDNRVEIVVQDDGRGIDHVRIRDRAVQEGILTKEAAGALSEREALELIFHSGLSTSPMITDISGRGVGLNVVRENIASLGGELYVVTEKGKRSRFVMSLPVSLSNARGVLVRSSGRMYIVPLQHVDKGMVIHREDLGLLDGKPVIEYRDKPVTVQRLDEMLAMPSAAKREEQSQMTLLVLSLGGTYLGVEVDEVLWEQDVVVKPLPPPVARVRTISGASLLSTGELVPVLHIPDLFDSARSAAAGPKAVREETTQKRSTHVLVVDDSITSRVLLHDILLSSGYTVNTAVDGIDALTCLREEEYDIIVSDVEMPRMNGFELTEAIRRDEKLRELPVVLVTGLESKEDRERGFDVGANAYIIKSSFDQSNLLEVISRLV